MTATNSLRLALGIFLLAVLASVITSVEGQQRVESQSENFLGQFEPTQLGHPSFVSPHASPIAANNYLVKLIDLLDVDIEAEALQKIKENAEKYPIEKVKGKSAKYTDL